MGVWLIDDSLYGLRASAALCGVASVVPLFVLLRNWWGERLAILMTPACVSSHWFLFLCHSGVHYVQALLFATLLLWLLVLSHHTRKMVYLVLSGIVLGLALLSYQANHILPLLWIGSQVVWCVTGSQRFRDCVISVAIPLGVALVVIAPLLVHDYSETGRLDVFTQRAESVSIFASPNWQHLDEVHDAEGSVWVILWSQVLRSVLAPVAVPDSSGQFGAGMPKLDRWMAMLLMLGLAVSLPRLRDERVWVPLLWCGSILVAGAVLLIDAPFYPRLAGATFLWYLPIAMLVALLLHALPKPVAASYGLVAVALLVLLSSMIHLHQFFVVYRSVDDVSGIHFSQTRLARFVQQVPEETFVYVYDEAMGRIGSGTVQFLVPDARGQDITSLDELREDRRPWAVILAPEDRDALAAMLGRYPEARVERHMDGFDLVCYEVRVPR